MAKKKPSRAIKLFGTEVPDGKRRELRAGPISAVFDSGALRYIRYHGEEVLRGIAYIVRDKDWGTYAPAIENLKVRQNKGGFTIGYEATCKDKDQAIRYSAKIDARSDGTLKFSAKERRFLTSSPIGPGLLGCIRSQERWGARLKSSTRMERKRSASSPNSSAPVSPFSKSAHLSTSRFPVSR